MSRLQSQLATNKRINKLSDDPVGVISALQSRTKISRLEQYRDNISAGLNWLTVAETSLREVDTMLQTVYEQTIFASNDTNTAYDRGSVAVYVKQMMDHLVQTVNSSIGDQYVFAGYNTTHAPFKLNGGVLEYNGICMYGPGMDAAALGNESLEHKNLSTGFNLTTSISMTGVEIMGTGEHNIYKIMSDLYDALMMDDSPTAPHNDPEDPAYDPNLMQKTISQQISKLQKAQENNLANIVQIGGKTNRLEMMDSRYSEDIINYTERKSYVEDADQAEVIMRFKMSEAVYQAALAAGARIIQPTLMDFLR